MPKVQTSFELKDGRELTCEYEYCTVYGVHTLSNGDPGYPDETDLGDPTYYLDGKEISLNKLPKGLDTIAEQMYDAGSGQFNYREFDLADAGEYDHDF